MSRIVPKAIDELGDLASLVNHGAEVMGFMAEDALIMAHCPDMLKGTGHMINSILGTGTIDPGLKRMLGFITSQASGCHYCSAHTSYTAIKNGIEQEKLNAIWEYATSDLFSDQEKAALDFANKAGMVPNACTAEDYDKLSLYFSTEEIVEIVFTLSLYAFLNKFNDTVKTTIEEAPAMAYENLKQQS